MAKFRYPSKLTKKEQDELLLDFCYVISSLSDVEKAAQLIRDLLSPQEAEMLAKRVKIACLLIKGNNYNYIHGVLKASPSTIARVNDWLKYSGEGYRFAAERLKRRKKEKTKEGKAGGSLNSTNQWRKFKRKFPLYFWPELIIEEIIEGASKRQKQRLLSTLEKMKDKPQLYGEIKKIVKQNL